MALRWSLIISVILNPQFSPLLGRVWLPSRTWTAAHLSSRTRINTHVSGNKPELGIFFLFKLRGPKLKTELSRRGEKSPAPSCLHRRGPTVYSEITQFDWKDLNPKSTKV